jgi:tetratricopeptide (TPR) repeat protein
MAETTTHKTPAECIKEAETILFSLGREQEAIRRDFQAQVSHWDAGAQLTESGRDQCTTAIQYCDTALAQGTANPRAWYLKGEAYHLARDYLKAVQCFDRVLASQPDDVRALAFKGVCLTLMNKTTPAICSFDRALAIDPANDYIIEQKERALRECSPNQQPGTDRLGAWLENSLWDLSYRITNILRPIG